jgi:hypothetical protein
MPVSPISRYRNLSVFTVLHPTRGATQSLPIRRPAITPGAGGRQQPFTAYDTFDLMALRFLGVEQLYWYILDANGYQLPAEFTVGETVLIPPPAAATRVSRTGG